MEESIVELRESTIYTRRNKLEQQGGRKTWIVGESNEKYKESAATRRCGV